MNKYFFQILNIFSLQVITQLPDPNYNTLEFLLKHLHRVSLHHKDTGMTAKNLAIVWAPNLLRSPALEAGGVEALQVRHWV